MYKLSLKQFIKFIAQSFNQAYVINAFDFALGVKNAIKAWNQQLFNAISTTIVLSALLTACGGGGGGSTAPTTLIAPAPTTPPTLVASTANINVQEDFRTPVFVTITATDADGEAIALSLSTSTRIVNAVLSTLSNGVSTITFTAIANVNGSETLTVLATDAGGRSTSVELVVRVDAVNDAPTLTVPTTTLTLIEDFSSTRTIATATDVENNPLTITVSESNTGVVSVTTSASGVQIEANENANGQTTLTISVSDGTDITSTQVSLSVTAINDAPTLTVATTTLTFIEDFTGTRMIATAADVENNTLTLTVSESNAEVVSVTTSASGVQIEANEHANGQTTLTISVSDGTTITSTQVSLSVTAINDTPTISVSTNSITTLGGFTPITINTTASDVENGVLAFTVLESTTGVVRVTTSANAIVLNTIDGASGTTTLTITAVDSSGTTVTQSISVSVNIITSAVPVLTIPTNRINVEEDFRPAVVIRATVTDSDSSTLILSVTQSMRLVDVAISTRTNNISTITLTAIADLNGTTTVTFRATDEGGQTNSTEIVVVVTAVNDTPTLTISTTNFVVTEDFVGAITVATANDVESNPLIFSVIESDTGVVTVTTSASGVHVSSIADVNGVTTLSITVSDGMSSSTTQVVLTVTPVNDPPTLTVSSNRISIIGVFSPITINTTASDTEDDVLTFAVEESSTGVVRVTTSANAIILNAITGASGTNTLTVSAIDSSGATVTQTITVIVNLVPSTAPVLTISTSLVSVQEDFTGSVNIRTTATDADGDTLTLSVRSSSSVVNTLLSTLTNDLSTITLTAVGNAYGTATLTIQVIDAGGQSASTEIVVVVVAVNDTPTLSISTTNLIVAEDFSGSSTVATAIDIDGDTPIFSVVESTTGLITVSTSAAGVFVSSIRNLSGVTTLLITVSDAELSSTAQVVVDVTPVNDPPSLTVSTTALTLAEDFAAVLIGTTRTDIDSNSLTLSVSESTTGVVTVTVTTTGVSVSSIENINGRTTLTISLSDGDLSTTTQVVVDVTAINDPPSLTVSTTSLTLAEDFAAVLIGTTRTDVDSTTLILTVAESATGVVTVQTTTLGVSVSSIENINGRTTLTITLSDSLLTSTAQVVVGVTAVNDPPSLTVSTTALTLAEDFAEVLIGTTRTDIDSNNLALTVAESATGVVTVQTSTSGISVSSIENINGRTTLTINLSDGDQITTAQVVVDVTAVNDPPSLTVSTTALTLAEDFAEVLIGTTRTDIDSTTLTLTVAESATGVVTVQTSTSGISVSSLENINGRTTLTITLSDGDLTTNTQVVIDVTPINDPPVLSVTTPAFLLSENFATFVILVNRSDVDSNTLTLTVAESATGVVTVTPTTLGFEVSSIRSVNGITTLTISLSDGDLTTTTQVVIDVGPINDPPSLTVSTTALTVAEDFATVLIATTRTDIDSTTLTLTVAESTTGVVTVTVTTTGVSVSSIENINGRTTLTITLSDGRLSTTTQVVVEVTPVNDPPVLTVTMNTLTLGEDFGMVLIGTNSSDIDSNTLTLTVAESATGVVTVQTTTSGVSVLSIENINGRTTLTITLSDSQLSSTAQVVVDVSAVNDPPVLTVSTNALTLSEDFATVLIATTRTDIDSTTLTLAVAESATGVVTVTITDAGVQVANITDTNGVTTLTISLSDGDLTTTTEVVVEVTGVNDPPSLTVSTTALTLAEDFAAVLIGTTRTDIDSNSLTLTVSESATGVVTVLTTTSGVSVSSIENINGQTTLTITLSDGDLTTNTQVVIDVTPINDPPVLSVTTPAFNLSENFATFVIVVNRSDVDSNTLTLTVVESATGVVTVTPTTSGYEVSSIRSVNGITTLTITLSDGDLTTSTQVLIDVTGVNDPPVLTVSTNVLSLAEEFGTVLIATTRTDIDSTTLTLTVVESTTGVVTVTVTTTGVSVSSIENINGRTTLTITLSDGRLSATTQVVIDVTPVNDPPTLTVSTTSLTLAEDFAAVLIGTTRTDIDSNSLTLTVTESATGVVSVLTSTSGISVSSIENINGRTTLTITLSDSQASVSTQVVVTVNAVNDPPTLTIPTSILTESEDFMGISTVATAMDLENDTLTLSVVESTTGVITVTTLNSGVQIANIAHANGRTTLTITVSDSTLSSTTQVVVIITPVNDTPTLTIPTAALTEIEDFMGITTIATVVNVDSDTLTLTVVESTTGVVTVTTSTLGVQIASFANAVGRTTLSITVSDSILSSTAQVVVTITPVNDTPTFTLSSSSLTIFEDFDTTVSITVTSNDLENDTLTISVVASPTGVITVTTSNSVVQLRSIANVNGVTTLNIAVSDGQNSSTQQVLVTVQAVNDTPTFTLSTMNLSLIEDFDTTIPITVMSNDIDNDTLTITVVESPPGVVTVTTSALGVQITSFANGNGVTTLTIIVSDETLSSTDQVVVSVTAVEDTPTIFVSTDNILTNVGFSVITINTTASDAEDPALTFSVTDSTPGVVRVTTSTNAIVLNSIPFVSGQTNLTIRTTDSAGLTAVQTIAVNVVTALSAPPVLTVSTNLIRVDEDFTTAVVIITTATDAENGPILISVSSSTPLVRVDISSPVSGISTFTNMITLSAILNANGVTTLTVEATDSGGNFTSEEIVVVVNSVTDSISFSLSTSGVALTTIGSQLNRNIQNITVSNPGDDRVNAQFQVTSSGSPIFSTNPAPVVSYTTNALTTMSTLTSTTQSAQLYFSIAPNQEGTATLTIRLNDLTRSEMSQQTMVVVVNRTEVPPVIVQANPNIQNLMVDGGRLYANSVRTAQEVTSFLVEARNLGGHLININTVEEFNFVNSPSNPLIANQSWIGLVLPQQTFPGELFWISNDSTIAYGFSSTNDRTLLNVYPGHYPLTWNPMDGLLAHRITDPAPVFNWTIFDQGLGTFFLLNDQGDPSFRRGLYEFPNGLAPATINPISVIGSTATVRLTGFDLNRDAVNLSDWTATATNGTVTFNNIAQNQGVRTVDLVFTAPANFDGRSTVVVTLDVNGLTTSTTIIFAVDGPPSIALSTHAITVLEDFTNFVIAASATDVVDVTVPLNVTASSTGVIAIATSANSIQFSGAPQFSGVVTLTVQTIDSVSLTDSTQVVVTILSVNDTPTLTVSSDNVSVLGGFVPFSIGTTATDVESDTVAVTVSASVTGVVSITTLTNVINFSPIVGGSGRTTITVTAVDGENATAVQTIAINVIVMSSTTPVLTVASNLIRLPEDFSDFVLGTTATDAEDDTLTVTISSLTSLVNAMVVSTHNITLSSRENIFGTSTISVRTRDSGGIFISTEVVVIVESVNDTPTITVSSPTVDIITSTVLLSVAATDVESGVLAFSVSSGQGLVNTAITTSSLAISRISNFVGGLVVLTLTTTDTDGGTYSTNVTVIVQSAFRVTTTGVKTLEFAWDGFLNANHYQLQSEPFFGEGYADLSTTGLVVSPNSTNIRQTSAQAFVSLHRYISRVNDPQYGVMTCDTTASCNSSFRHNTVALTNTQLNGMIGRIVANDVGTNDNFGTSVSLSGDGNTLAVGTLPFQTPPRVYIFRRNGSTWSQQANLQASNANQQFIPSLFGQSVSLSADGNTVVVGAPNEGGANSGINNFPSDPTGYQAFGSGAAYVFTFSAGAWSQQAYIKASNTQVGDIFGTFVSLSGDGNTLAVGAINEDSSARGIGGTQSANSVADSGAVYVFSVVGGSWTQHSYIKASNTGAGDHFGHSVSLSNDGRTLAVGAEFEDGSSIGINGADNDTASAAGATYVFRFNGIAWNQEAYIKPLNTGADDAFGQSVSLSGNGNMLAVGAFHEDGSSTGVNGSDNNSASDSGATYVFRFMSGAWTQQAYIKAANPDMGDDFGHSVSLSEDGTVLAVGAADEDGSASGVGGNYTNDVSFMNSGATYVFELSNGTWAQRGYVKASDPSSGNVFGRSVSLSNDGGTLAVGASGVNTQSGAVYLY